MTSKTAKTPVAAAIFTPVCLLGGIAASYITGDAHPITAGIRFGIAYLLIAIVLLIAARSLSAPTRTIAALVITTATMSIAATICANTHDSETRLTATVVLTLAALSFLGHMIDLRHNEKEPVQ